MDNIVKRIDEVEKLVKSGKLSENAFGNVNYTPNSHQKVDNFVENPKIENKKIVETTEIRTNTEDFWPKVVDNLKKSGKVMLYTNLIQTNAVKLNDMIVGIEFPNRYDTIW